MRTIKTHWLLGFLFLLSTLFWMGKLWGSFPATLDTLEYVFPEKWFNVESFRKGLIPLWNPFLACGTPHVANLQSAAFYPPFWLWNWTGLAQGFIVLSLVHGLWAALGFYFWLRAQALSPVLAALCGASFGGSALLVHYWGFPTHLASISWVPWAFWAAKRLAERPSWERWALSAVIWSLQLLAGYPFFTFYAALFMALWMWAKVSRDLRVHLVQGGAFAAALALTACQWLPFVDFLGYLHRAGWGGNVFSLRWVNYLTLLQPQILGVPGTASYKGDYPDFIFNNLYLGLVPLGLLAASSFSSKARDIFWRGSALFWGLWLAGDHFLVWRVLPADLLDRVEPSKASFLFVFCALTALALSLGDWMAGSSRKNPWRSWTRVLALVWVLDLLAVPARVVHPVPNPYLDPGVQKNAERVRSLLGEGRLVSLRDQEHYYSPEVRGFADSFKATAEDLIPNTNVVWGLRSAKGYLTIFTDGYQNLESYLQRGYAFSYGGRVLDAAGVDLVLFHRPLAGFKYRSIGSMGHLVLTKNAGALGPAWEADTVREFPGRRELWEGLLDPNAFLEKEIYTEKGQEGRAVVLPPPGRPLAGGEPSLWEGFLSWGRSLWGGETEIRNERLSPCRAKFHISAARKGFLVFNESFSPGWHAWVDGKPEAIFRADGLGMAVVLPREGAHQAEFRYEPASFRLGLFLSLASLAALGWFLALKGREISVPWTTFR